MKWILEAAEYFSKNKIDSLKFDYFLHSRNYELVRFDLPEINKLKILLNTFEFKHTLDEFDDDEFEENLQFIKDDIQVSFTLFKVKDKEGDTFYLLHYLSSMKSSQFKFDDWASLFIFIRKQKKLKF